MFSFVIAIHIIACVGLIFFIMIQQGRGGGLIESFSSAESLLGSKTNKFLTKTTTGLAITFFITCLSLAFISVQQSKSVVERHSVITEEAEQATQEVKEEADKGQATETNEKDDAAGDQEQQN